jgi:hypothetical protein
MDQYKLQDEVLLFCYKYVADDGWNAIVKTNLFRHIQYMSIKSLNYCRMEQSKWYDGVPSWTATDIQSFKA